MKSRSFLIILLTFMSTGLYAGNDAYVVNQQRFLKIMPVFQSWEVEQEYKVSEVSLPLFLYFPLNRQFSFSIRGSGAHIQGDVPELSGISDTQFMFNYHHEATNLVLNLALNIPNGKNELTSEEFQTSSKLSYNYFNFHTPNLGQGFNMSPGLTWAFLFNDKAAIGLGVSYQYKGKFKPLKDMIYDYDPGDEILITTGFDFRLDEVSTFSTDVIFVTYTTDMMDENKVFDSGNSFVVNLQYKRFFQYNELWLLARYRTKTKNSYVIGGIFQEEAKKRTPEQLEGMGHFRIRMNQKLYLSVLGEVRSYYPNFYFQGLDIFGIGLATDMFYSPHVKIPARAKYFFGDFPGGPNIFGWELAIGFEFSF